LKLFASLLLSLFVAYAASCFLTIHLNPEVRFWNEAVTRRLDDIASIRANQPGQPVILFTGGSSTAFSIDPQIIEDVTAHPAVNLGLPVASGSRYILHQALREARSGDLIVIGTEPDLLTYPDQESSPSKLGFALEATRGNPAESAGGATFGNSLTIPQYLTLSRPGVDYLVTLVGRTLSGKGYRYKKSEIRYRGLIQTPVHNESMRPIGPREKTTLHTEGRKLLEMFAAAAAANGIRLAYSIPLTYTATEDLPRSREQNRKLLAEINSIIPVVDDGYSGAIDDIGNFADGARHLSAKGQIIRSQALAQALLRHLQVD
jgi:hypothetical protein